MISNLKFSQEKYAVVDESGEVVLGIQSWGGEDRFLTAVLHVPGQPMIVSAIQSILGKGDNAFVCWKVVRFAGNQPTKDPVFAEQLLTQALQAYGIINGFGSSEKIVVSMAYRQDE